MILDSSIAIDTETTGFYPRNCDIFSVQIGTGNDNYLIDLQVWNDGFKFEQIIPYIKNKHLVLQNAQFDLAFFYKYGFYPDKIQDTFLASKILYNGYASYRHGFAYIFERELGVIYDKSEQQNIANVMLRNHKAIAYCFQDVDRLLELARHLYKKCVNEGCLGTYRLHCNYARVLAYVEICGLPINKEKWLKKMELDLENLEKAKSAVIEYIYSNLPKYQDPQIDLFCNKKKLRLNLDSPSQMIPVFEDLKIDVETSDGKKSIKKDVINKSEHEFLDIWDDYQTASHTVSTFGATVADKIVDGRIYTSFNPILDTSRISTRKNEINFLNLPANPETRDCFEHSEGYQMIVSDYDAHEGVVNACLTNDKVMREAVLEDKDLHCAFARKLFPELKDVDDDTMKAEHKSKRDAAKAPRFLFQYGGNAFTLYTNENIPLEEAEQIEADFRDLHRGIYEWGDKVLAEALRKGYIESCLGFRLHLSYYDEFIELAKRLEELDNDFWQDYRKGKAQYVALRDYNDFITNPPLKDEEDSSQGYLQWKGEIPQITDRVSYDAYRSNRQWISEYFSKKSKYLKLCLNNPIQSTASHQFKNGGIRLFEKIIENGHQGRVRICNPVHDEWVLEVEDALVEQYKTILEDAMINGGMELMPDKTMMLKAEAKAGKSWYQAK
jgi:DNA polymerase I-like protein with 3'-5' exonuclease and polymerase domains